MPQGPGRRPSGMICRHSRRMATNDGPCIRRERDRRRRCAPKLAAPPPGACSRYPLGVGGCACLSRHPAVLRGWLRTRLPALAGRAGHLAADGHHAAASGGRSGHVAPAAQIQARRDSHRHRHRDCHPAHGRNCIRLFGAAGNDLSAAGGRPYRLRLEQRAGRSAGRDRDPVHAAIGLGGGSTHRRACDRRADDRHRRIQLRPDSVLRPHLPLYRRDPARDRDWRNTRHRPAWHRARAVQFLRRRTPGPPSIAWGRRHPVWHRPGAAPCQSGFDTGRSSAWALYRRRF